MTQEIKSNWKHKILRLFKRIVFIIFICAASYLGWIGHRSGKLYKFADEVKSWWRHKNTEVQISQIINERNEPKTIVKVIYTSKNYSQEEIDELIEEWSEYYQVDPVLSHSVAQIESAKKQDATRFEDGYYNCYLLGQGCKKLKLPWALNDNEKRLAATSWGIFQLMPKTAVSMAKMEGLQVNRITDLTDADLNIQLGIRYIRYCINHSNQNYTRFSKCYNGPLTKTWWPKVWEILLGRLMKPYNIEKHQMREPKNAETGGK